MFYELLLGFTEFYGKGARIYWFVLDFTVF